MNRNERLNILIVDDQRFAQLENLQIVSELCKEISSIKPNIVLASSIQTMEECLKSQDFHLVLLDKDLGPSEVVKTQKNGVHKVVIACNQDSIEHIPSILAIQPHARIIMVTAYEDIQLSVKAIQNGAMDYITKGNEPHKVEYKNKQILKALRDSQLELQALRRSYYQTDSSANKYVFQSKAMREIDRNLKALSQANVHVLILGESGSGKTETAKRLGKLTQKFRKERERVFVNLNVAAISDTLIESELFGHEKGAFIGATKTRKGFFEIARNGDLFLDGIGDASLNFQAKILKVICEKEFRRVGGRTPIKTNNIRLIFASNKNLEDMVKKGLFRKDLYERISVAVLKMPSLNDRKEDIPILCQRLANVLNKKNRKNISYADFPPPLQDYFKENNLELNIRGLKNNIERLMVFCPLKSNGKIDYKNWKHVLSYKDFQKGSEEENLELDQLMNLTASKIAKRGGPGLKHAKAIFEKKIISKVQSDFTKNRDRARILKISEPLASMKFKS